MNLNDLAQRSMSHYLFLGGKLILNTLPGWMVVLLEKKLDWFGVTLILIGAGFWYWRQTGENLKIMREANSLKLDNELKRRQLDKLNKDIENKVELKALIREEVRHIKIEEATAKSLTDETEP